MQALFSRLRFLASGLAAVLGGCAGSSQAIPAPAPPLGGSAPPATNGTIGFAEAPFVTTVGTPNVISLLSPLPDVVPPVLGLTASGAVSATIETFAAGVTVTVTGTKTGRGFVGFTWNGIGFQMPVIVVTSCS